jgi:metallopeptidase MepB
MHDLLARTQYSRFHGYAVPPEFGEGIGTMLENWCWIKDELKTMSRHYTRIDPRYMESWKETNAGAFVPQETIPDELLENLIKRRPLARLDHHLQQL